MIDSIRIAETDEEIKACFPVMQELRPNLEPGTFVSRVRELQRLEGYRLAYLSDGSGVVATAGFRVLESLSRGRFLFVDDLVTLAVARSKGYGAALLHWLEAFGADQGCGSLQLDSGLHRVDAHRFYDREGFARTSIHFAKRIDANRSE